MASNEDSAPQSEPTELTSREGEDASPSAAVEAALTPADTALDGQGTALQGAGGNTETGGGTETSTGLRVRVDFRAGQVELPLAELLALSEGQVLPRLDGVVFPRVEALSAGRVFAEGELVEVEGRVGFRVTKLLR